MYKRCAFCPKVLNLANFLVIATKRNFFQFCAPRNCSCNVTHFTPRAVPFGQNDIVFCKVSFYVVTTQTHGLQTKILAQVSNFKSKLSAVLFTSIYAYCRCARCSKIQ